MTTSRQTPAGTTLSKPVSATFADHVVELRRRLLWVALAFAIGSCLAYSYRQVLLDVILKPLDGQQLVYLTPGGGFSFIFQISMYAGLILAAPVLVYHIYSFIRPALPARAQRSALRIVLAASGLILGGIAYGYLVAVPAALKFLMEFAEGAVTPNLTADSYLSFFLAYIGGLALLALLPLVLVFYHWISPLKPGGLLKSERWVIVFAFVAAAIITPTPDIINQAMIAVPIIALYQLGVAAVLISILKQHKGSGIQNTLRPTPAVTAKELQPSAAIRKSTPRPAMAATSQPLTSSIANQVHKVMDFHAMPTGQLASTHAPHKPRSTHHVVKLHPPARSNTPRPVRPSSRPTVTLQQRRNYLSMDGMIAG